MPVLSQAACGSYSGSESRTETVMGGGMLLRVTSINCSGLAGNLNIPSREYLIIISDDMHALRGSMRLLFRPNVRVYRETGREIGKRRVPPRFPAKSAISLRGMGNGDFRVWAGCGINN